FSGLITLGSGLPFDIGDASSGTFVLRRGEGTPEQFNFIIPGAWAYRNVDLHVRKDLPALGAARWGITADLFNAFNYQNFGCINNFIPTPRSEEHTSELQSLRHLVCRLLLEKKKRTI